MQTKKQNKIFLLTYGLNKQIFKLWEFFVYIKIGRKIMILTVFSSFSNGVGIISKICEKQIKDMSFGSS